MGSTMTILALGFCLGWALVTIHRLRQRNTRHDSIALRALSREATYAALDSERAYQERRWPGGRTVDEFVLYLIEYTDQARRIAGTTDDKKAKLDAIRKVGGLAVACMDQHGAPHRGK